MSHHFDNRRMTMTAEDIIEAYRYTGVTITELSRRSGWSTSDLKLLLWN